MEREQQLNENQKQSVVKQEGIITKITNDTITVALQGNSNCAGCKAKAACGISESNLKEIEVSNSDRPVCVNDKVNVLLRKDLGLKAVLWAYLFPFILMISTLFIGVIFFEEWLAGVLALGILIPYYMLLFVFQDEFRNAFRVTILKFN